MLGKVGINAEPYEKHISSCKEYDDFLYLNDDKYTKENVFKLSSNEKREIVYKSETADRYLLKIQKYLCAEFAKIMFSESTELQLDNKSDEKTIEAVKAFYKDFQMWQKIEKAMFDVFGLGTLGMCIYYDEAEGIRTKNYKPYNIIPLTIIDDEIKDVCFRSVKDNGNIVLNIFTRATAYSDTVTEGEPTVRKTVFSGYNNVIAEFTKDGKTVDVQEPKYTDYRPFVILKPFALNTGKYTSSIGQPIYWDNLDIIKTIDKFYNLGNKDADLSQKQTFVNNKMVLDQITGRLIIPSSLATAHIIAVNGGQDNSNNYKDFIHTHAPQMIVGEYYEKIEWNLKLLSEKLGLGANELTLEKVLAPTATQVISSNTAKYTTIQKHMNSMYAELTVMNKAIISVLNMTSEYNGSLDTNAVIGFKLDDGVIEDRATITERAKSEVESGLMSVYFYLRDIKRLQGDELTKELDLLGYDADGKKRQVEPIAPIIELSEE